MQSLSRNRWFSQVIVSLLVFTADPLNLTLCTGIYLLVSVNVWSKPVRFRVSVSAGYTYFLQSNAKSEAVLLTKSSFLATVLTK